MCEYCHSFPHLSGCPNALEEEPKHTCAICGDGIYAGDKYCELDDEYYHKECLKDNAFIMLLELYNANVRTED